MVLESTRLRLSRGDSSWRQDEQGRLIVGDEMKWSQTNTSGREDRLIVDVVSQKMIAKV